jgi:hypothetical protein
MAGNPARRLLQVLGGLLVVAGLGVALLPVIGRTDVVRRLFSDVLSRSTGFDVEIGSLSLARDLSIEASDVRLQSGEAEVFLDAERVDLAVRPHFAPPFLLVRADIESPHLYVDRLPSAPAEQHPQTKSSPPSLPLLDVKIRDGFVHSGDRAFGPIALDLAPETGAGPLQAKGSVRLGAPENELRWTAGLALAERRLHFAADGEAADLPALLRHVAGLDIPKTIAGKASTLHLDGEMQARPDGVATARLHLAADGVKGHNEDQSRAIQGVKADGTLELSLGADGRTIARLELGAPAGEALWDRFYVDLSGHVPHLRLEASRADGAVRIEKADLTIGGLATLVASGTYEPSGEGQRLEAQVGVPDLAPLYRLALQEPFRDSHPSLSDVAVAGTLQAQVDLQTGARTRATGVLHVSGGRVEGGSSLQVRDLSVELPFLIGAGGAKRKEGYVRAGEVALAGAGVEGLRLDLVAEPDAISLAHPTRLELLGGTVDLNHFSASDLAAVDRRATMGVSLHGLDLRRLSQALGMPPLTGTISGAVPAVTIANGNVRSNGEIAVKAFDGVIRIRDLHFDQVLSPVPELALDASFEGISLGRLTAALEVGHVSGVVHGAVENLVVVHGEPVSFDAWMETVDVPGVAQKVSVTALRQLSILGGSGGDPISRGILSLFDEYGYAKMGFRCRLRNDRFLLHGVESSDGNEILVVGSFLPPRVNVVSHNQVIAFSEMVRRLRRAAEAGGEGPAVRE